MNTYPLKIVSLDELLLNEEVIELSLRGEEGDLAVLAGHIPFMTTVKPCECKVVLANEEVKTFPIKSGILYVTPQGNAKLLLN
jgi:F-type H+-transporting ATPase subunit epsilon